MQFWDHIVWKLFWLWLSLLIHKTKAKTIIIRFVFIKNIYCSRCVTRKIIYWTNFTVNARIQPVVTGKCGPCLQNLSLYLQKIMSLNSCEIRFLKSSKNVETFYLTYPQRKKSSVLGRSSRSFYVGSPLPSHRQRKHQSK